LRHVRGELRDADGNVPPIKDGGESAPEGGWLYEMKCSPKVQAPKSKSREEWAGSWHGGYDYDCRY
jgi:hypothetical protein